jgi:hypothetical protein
VAHARTKSGARAKPAVTVVRMACQGVKECNEPTFATALFHHGGVGDQIEHLPGREGHPVLHAKRGHY